MNYSDRCASKSMVCATLRIFTSENGMEALELDTPTETVSVPENSPPSENLMADL